MGIIVNDFLVKYFPSVVDLSFTAKVEKEFDEIAAGKMIWNEMIKSFYADFHPLIDKIEKSVDRKEVVQTRVLGKDPKTNREMIARMTKFGPVVEIVAEDETQKPMYANLKKGQRIETISYEEALDLFKLPRNVGVFEGQPVSINSGPFGIYAKHASGNVSLPKDADPMLITLEEVIALFLAKREADANKVIKTFPENDKVRVLNGRYGPYIAFEQKNVKIPKGADPRLLTYEECVALAEATPEKPSRFAKKKANAAESTAKSKPESQAKTAKKASTDKKSTAKSTAKKSTGKKKGE
jgi:DNA topoisomerase-1